MKQCNDMFDELLEADLQPDGCWFAVVETEGDKLAVRGREHISYLLTKNLCHLIIIQETHWK